jgi:hypothetical protein
MSSTANSPAEAITEFSNDYAQRFIRYVPGYDYLSAEEYASKPGFLVQDPGVDPILEPGESFVIGYFWARTLEKGEWAAACDLLFDDSADGVELTQLPGFKAKRVLYGASKGDSLTNCMLNRRGGQWNETIQIFKILNDSIFEGTKGIIDPRDFKLVELFGDYTHTPWNPDGVNTPISLNQNLTRKSSYWRADTIANYSFDTTLEKSQWVYRDITMIKAETGLSQFAGLKILAEGMGFHGLDPITEYKSTINSLNYVVSDGYVSPQKVIGITTGTNIETFLGNIIKPDSGQFLKFISGSDGNELVADALLSNNDTLYVTSADSVNMTKYVLEVSDEGLDDDAVLVAKDGSGLEITIDGNSGTISGFDAGTGVGDVLNNVTVPATATLNVVDANDTPVPLNIINTDTVLVKTTATHYIYFEVIAQDNKTIIKYQLSPGYGAEDALLFSDYYSVDQDARVIEGIPSSTRVHTLHSHISVSEGATAILVDKAGNERTLGDLAYDDLILVTSEDGNTTNTYYLQFFEEPQGLDAYVTSSILSIDQIDLMITNVVENTTIEDLIGMLTPAPGASMMILDAGGSEATSGNVSEGFQVQVTSASGTVIVVYDITIMVSNSNNLYPEISVYPNPSTGELYIAGLRANTTLRVVDITGKVVKTISSEQIHAGKISIADQPDGIYFIIMSVDDYFMKTLKVLKQ